MFDRLSKSIFHSLAAIEPLKKLSSRYGMRPGGFARRFIAGETPDEAIASARIIELSGLAVTLDYLGESVASAAEATAATDAYLAIVRQIAGANIGRNISLKLTQLGLDIDVATATANLRRILDVAAPEQFFVRIDMESSAYTSRTLDIFEALWREGYRSAGVVIQSYLNRSEEDVRRLIALGARVRLVKGAYQEPLDVAFAEKREVDDAYIALMKLLLAHGNYPAIATHDPTMIDATKSFAAANNIAKDRFEFQMLYGIRRDLQVQLAGEGYPFRVYVPFGREWYPYFMRRLGERPANIGFVLKSVFREGR